MSVAYSQIRKQKQRKNRIMHDFLITFGFLCRSTLCVILKTELVTCQKRSGTPTTQIQGEITYLTTRNISPKQLRCQFAMAVTDKTRPVINTTLVFSQLPQFFNTREPTVFAFQSPLTVGEQTFQYMAHPL